MADASRFSVHIDERHLIDRILMPSLIGCINTVISNCAGNMTTYDENNDDDGDKDSHSYGHFMTADFQFIIHNSLAHADD